MYISGLNRHLILIFPRYTTTDSDSWFKTRELQHEDLKKQMETLQKDIVSMKQQKMTLFVSTTTFRRNLLDLLGMQIEDVFIHCDKS